MRQLAMALILVLPICSPALGLSVGNGALSDVMVQAKCTMPDSELIKPGTSDQYNAQAKGFNDCLRIYVQNENNKIALIRANASSQLDSIKDGALSQIRDIERAINTAIIEVSIVNGGAQVSELPPPATALAAFPAASCNKPDEALLKPARGKQAASLKNLDRYEDQRLAFEACMRTYIAQAKNEIQRIKADAEFACKQITRDANPRIDQINNDVIQALADAAKASGERDAKVNAIHSPMTASSLSPDAYQPGGRGPSVLQAPQAGTESVAVTANSLSPDAYQPGGRGPSVLQALQAGTESVTVTGDRLPRSTDMPTGAGDPDAISCRAPQQLTDSRLMGPEICKHNRDWASIFKRGLNISPDGTSLVQGGKQLSYQPQACIVMHSVNTLPVVTTTCGTPGGQ
jgi:hypothetical protein